MSSEERKCSLHCLPLPSFASLTIGELCLHSQAHDFYLLLFGVSLAFFSSIPVNQKPQDSFLGGLLKRTY